MRIGQIQESDQEKEPPRQAVRSTHEKLIISLVRDKKELTKVEIAKKTGLSTQASTVIVNRLADKGYLLKGKPQKGKIGQPSVPYSLNPFGAYTIGLSVGRRSSSAILVNFTGDIVAQRQKLYAYPDPDDIGKFAVSAISRLTGNLSQSEKRKAIGVGVASPYEIWNWKHQMDAPRNALNRWQSMDLKALIEDKTDLRVFLQNDGSAAATAEFLYGQNGKSQDFLYFYIGAFVGGGLVIGGRVLYGPTNNAASMGSMMIRTKDGSIRALLEEASINTLARELVRKNTEMAPMFDNPAFWEKEHGLALTWLERAACALAHATHSSLCVFDFPKVVIDGRFPSSIRQKLCQFVKKELSQIDMSGISPCRVCEGSLGANARALGAASLPLLAYFSPENDLRTGSSDA